MKTFGSIQLFIVLWCAVVAAGCRDHAPVKKPPRAAAGVLDLRGWNLTRDGSVKLDGEWAFHPGAFIDPEDAPAVKSYLAFPGLWQGRGKFVPRRYGFASYRLTVLPGENRKVLALRLGDVYSAYRLYIGERLVLQRGRPGISAASTKAARGPPGYVAFSPSGEKIVLTLHVANFHHRNGGPKYSVRLGDDFRMRGKARNAIAFEVFLCGILLMLGIYNVVLFAVRRKELSTVFFALFTWMFMLRTLVLGEMYLVTLLGELSWEIHSRLIYSASYLTAMAFASFIHQVFPDNFSRLTARASQVFLSALVLVTLFTSPRFHTWLFPPFEIYMGLLAVYITWVFARAVYQGRDDAGLYLGGWLLFFVAIFNDIMKNHELLDTVYLMPTAMAVMVVSQAILLSRRISRAFIASEKLSDILEDRVARRTGQLAQATNSAERARNEIERLNEFSKNLNTSADLDDVLRRIIDYIGEHFDQDGTWLWLVDRNRDELYAHSMNHRYTGVDAEAREFTMGLRLPFHPDSGTLYQVWKRGRFMHVPRIRESWMTETDRMLTERLNLKSFLHIPLKVQGQVIGIFSLTKSREMRFSREEIASMTRFCEQITGAVYSSSLLREVREEREKSEASRVELAAARDRAEESNRAKTEFLTTMSHEIRTPLNSIIGTADLLRETKLEREQIRFVEILNRAGRNLLNLINEILDLARLEAGKLRMEKQPFEPDEVRRNIMSVMRVRAEAEGLDISWRNEGRIPPVLLGDAGRLEQVLLNLLGNAVKFTERGSVRVRVTPRENDGSEIVLGFTVSDTGVGIPAHKLETIFERFTQVDSSITRKYGGTGLGLAICRRLVGMMGGEIHAESPEEGGSVFSFTARFGIAGDEMVSSTSQAARKPSIPAGTRILLAEDNEDNHYLVRAFLKDSDVILEDAENGRRALELFRERDYDIVLMDIQMPDMDGYTATRLIREHEKRTGWKRVPVIALTAHASPADIEKSLAAGCDGHLTKPIRKQTLMSALDEYLKREEFRTSSEHDK